MNSEGGEKGEEGEEGGGEGGVARVARAGCLETFSLFLLHSSLLSLPFFSFFFIASVQAYSIRQAIGLSKDLYFFIYLLFGDRVDALNLSFCG